jgi:hypothetical protein
LGIDTRAHLADTTGPPALEAGELRGTPAARPHFGKRTQLALVFLLALAFSLLSSSLPYFAVALAYGLAAARSLSQSDLTLFYWLRSSFAVESFLVFYVLGRRTDFRGQHLRLAVLSFGGALAGEFLQFVSFQTPSAGSSVISGFALVGVTFGAAVFVLSSAFQSFTVPFAGLALAFLRQDYLRAALWPSSQAGGRQLFSVKVLVVGLVITTMAYLASVVVEVAGASLVQSEQFGSLGSALLLFSGYAFYLFYPLLFFVAFYSLGKWLDDVGGIVAFAISAFDAGALGFLIGNDVVYFVRVLASSAQATSPFSLGFTFLEEAVVQGFYVLAFGLAAASLGFVRNMESPEGEELPDAATAPAVPASGDAAS